MASINLGVWGCPFAVNVLCAVKHYLIHFICRSPDSNIWHSNIMYLCELSSLTYVSKTSVLFTMSALNFSCAILSTVLQCVVERFSLQIFVRLLLAVCLYYLHIFSSLVLACICSGCKPWAVFAVLRPIGLILLF